MTRLRGAEGLADALELLRDLAALGRAPKHYEALDAASGRFPCYHDAVSGIDAAPTDAVYLDDLVKAVCAEALAERPADDVELCRRCGEGRVDAETGTCGNCGAPRIACSDLPETAETAGFRAAAHRALDGYIDARTAWEAANVKRLRNRGTVQQEEDAREAEARAFTTQLDAVRAAIRARSAHVVCAILTEGSAAQ